jgi:hypothetical protein
MAPKPLVNVAQMKESGLPTPVAQALYSWMGESLARPEREHEPSYGKLLDLLVRAHTDMKQLENSDRVVCPTCEQPCRFRQARGYNCFWVPVCQTEGCELNIQPPDSLETYAKLRSVDP